MSWALNGVKNDDVPQLTNKAMGALNLLPANIQETDQGGGCYKSGFRKFKSDPDKIGRDQKSFW